MTDADVLAEAKRRLEGLGTVSWVDDAQPPVRQFDAKVMMQLVDRALERLSELYVNLPFKREIHATDPVQALRNLRDELVDIELGNLTSMTEEEFHERLATIFVRLRDRHTVYILPDPYRRRIAFLPFVVESFEPQAGDDPVYVVTKVLGDDLGDGFKTPEHGGPAPRVTHWNGVPIHRAVAVNGDRNAGANRAARLARGLERLTFRWLGTAVAPDEDWVTVTFTTADGAATHDKRFRWLVAEAAEAAVAEAPGQASSRAALGRDLEGEWIRRVKAALHRKTDKWVGFAGGERVAFRVHRHGDGTYAYLRVYTFDLEQDELDAFLREITALVAREPTDGLIIDVRGNPGGLILGAERLISLFSPVPVEAQRLSFRNTPAAASLAERLFQARAQAFGANVREARATAAPFIASLALDEGADDAAQVYQPPVLVIFDALTYSAAEVFAAGMLDQRIALVAGTVTQSGGGGANVWSDALVREVMGEDPSDDLPFGASFNVSIRRITRIGARAGVAIEDVGVFIDDTEVIPVTEHDLTGDNADLLAAAAELLAAEQRYRLDATHDGDRTFTLRSANISRAQVLFDGELFGVVRAPDGKAVAVPEGEPIPARVDFLGFAGGPRAVASCRWTRA